jgi:putative membrane protein
VTLRWGLAAIHLLALAIGFTGIWERARALRGTLDAQGLRRVFAGDGLWGFAALLWIGTGAARAFGGLEKGTLYYMGQPYFAVKMALFAAILALEIMPMVTLIRWRIAIRRGEAVDVRRARLIARISDVQTLLVILIVFAATAMARGIRP